MEEVRLRPPLRGGIQPQKILAGRASQRPETLGV